MEPTPRKRRLRDAAKKRKQGIYLTTDEIMANYGTKKRAAGKAIREQVAKSRKDATGKPKSGA